MKHIRIPLFSAPKLSSRRSHLENNLLSSFWNWFKICNIKNACSVDLKAIYHLGCMFWMCLAHPWNYLRRCTLKYYDAFIQGYKKGTLWSNSGSARDKNNCIIIIKGCFCCTWTQMNLAALVTLSYLFSSLPAKYCITS